MLPEGPIGSVVKFLGLAVLLSFLWTALKGIYARLLRGGKNMKKYGAWGKIHAIVDLLVCRYQRMIVSTSCGNGSH